MTFLDTVWDDAGRWIELLMPCPKHVDYFVPSLPKGQALTGLGGPAEVAGALIDLAVSTVVLKMGGDGCLVMSEDKNSFHLPAFKVEVVDAPFACDAYVFNLFTKTPARVGSGRGTIPMHLTSTSLCKTC